MTLDPCHICGRDHSDPKDAELAELRAEVARLKIERDAALVHGPEDMIQALLEQRNLIETLERRIKGLHFANDTFGDAISRAERAEAERDALRAEVAQVEGVARGYMLAAEKAEAERDALADRVAAEGATAAAEIARLRADLADIVTNDEGRRGEVARLSAEVERQRERAIRQHGRAERLEAALREWRAAESSPDCIACCALDAATCAPVDE